MGADAAFENAQKTYDALAAELDRLEKMFLEMSQEEMH
jgi:hypothetical protein